MPNTLVHFAVQGIATRAAWRELDLRFVLAGALIPDLPWIANRIAAALPLGEALYDVHAYALAQSTLLVSLILAAALAALAVRPLVVFTVLGTNCLLHLLLDAAEIKWGDGVLLFAPWSWTPLNYGVVWPESALVLALSAVGLVFVLSTLRARRAARPLLCLTRGRVVTALLLAAAWLVLPALLSGGPYRADTHGLRTLREREQRAGRFLVLDRAVRAERPEGTVVRTFANEPLRLSGASIPPARLVSIRGTFLDPQTIAVADFHVHPRGTLRRDGATYVGLALFAAAFVLPLVRR